MDDNDPEKRQQQITLLRRTVVLSFLLSLLLAIIGSTISASGFEVVLLILSGMFLLAHLMALLTWLGTVIMPWIRFSLKSFLIAIVLINVFIASIVATDDAWVNSAGYLGIVIWVIAVGIGLLHQGVIGRFKAIEQKHFSAKGGSPKE